VAPFKRSSTSGYQTIFLGLCYSCNNFGHKDINCRSYAKKKINYEGYSNNSYPIRPREIHNIKYNSYGSLNDEVECYKCNNFGHMDKYCRLITPPREPKKDIKIHKEELQRIWRIKQDQFKSKECSLSLHAQHKKSGWYVGNGCSKHMTSDKNKFLTLRKEQDGSISFGNGNSTRIIGKGTVNLGSKYAKEENFLFVKDMKHNILTVIQMCDQGNKKKLTQKNVR
jgi:hypothetical protein